MATWWMPVQLEVELKNSRSPGSSEYRSTTLLRVCQYWSRDTRISGNLPAAALRYAANIRPEQSYWSGPSSDQTYGSPRWARANVSAATARGSAPRPCAVPPR
jgi:hypothetical protein